MGTLSNEINIVKLTPEELTQQLKRHKDAETSRRYYADNKEQKAARHKKYVPEHKEQLQANRNSENKNCACGCELSNSHKYKHEQSKNTFRVNG